ncbi:fimbrial protein [Photorhabdus sp. RM71S]|uniref:fimbrial protein n=1 Tax=Photorhabdus sp. RM71S TaxID=3342824 RepID=UPI0036DF94DE
MKKQILKTCVAAALCLGGMSQAMADMVSGVGILTVNSTVTSGTCEFSAMPAVDLTALTSNISVKDAVVAEKDVPIKVKNCPGSQNWKSDSNITSVELRVKGTAEATDYFQLQSGSGTPIDSYAVSLKADNKQVVPNTGIELKGNAALADDKDNTITLKAGLVKIGDSVVTAGNSTAALTVGIEYK